MVTSEGGSPSRSRVARCTASSVRIGSTGKGRRTRSSTARSTSRMKQRRSKVRRARTAACSSSGVSRPVARARMMARPASATVRAEVTCCVPRQTFFTMAVSRSSRAATRALTPCIALSSGQPWAGRTAPPPSGRIAAVEHYASPRSAVDQFGGRTPRQADVRPVLERVASLHRRMENAGGNELVPSTSGRLAGSRSWRHELRDDAPMSGDGNPLSRFDSPNIPAQVVLQLSNPGLHTSSIATCGHIGNGRGMKKRYRFVLSPRIEMVGIVTITAKLFKNGRSQAVRLPRTSPHRRHDESVRRVHRSQPFRIPARFRREPLGAFATCAASVAAREITRRSRAASSIPGSHGRSAAARPRRFQYSGPAGSDAHVAIALQDPTCRAHAPPPHGPTCRWPRERCRARTTRSRRARRGAAAALLHDQCAGALAPDDVPHVSWLALRSLQPNVAEGAVAGHAVPETIFPETRPLPRREYYGPSVMGMPGTSWLYTISTVRSWLASSHGHW